jgi:hypothetical protein
MPVFHQQIADRPRRKIISLPIIADLTQSEFWITHFMSWVYSVPDRVSISFRERYELKSNDVIRPVLPRKSSIRTGPRDCVLRFRKVRSLSWNLSNYRLASEAFALAFIGPDKKKSSKLICRRIVPSESTAFIAPRYMEIARKDNDSLLFLSDGP